MSLAADDHRYIWHPFTQQQGWVEEEPVIIASAEGTTLTDTEGRSYIDGVSSLWCNVHGHRHPAIDAAVRDQLGKVAHSTMLGLSHRPAIELAKRLIGIAPPGLSRVFFSDSGSTATEIALKMAFQYWAQHRQAPGRAKFVTLKDAYHGDTLGSVSAGGIDLFHETYRPLLFDTLKAVPGDIAGMERLLAQNEGDVAAVMIEPLVQGAAGMLMHPPGYLAAVRRLCDRYGVLLICDEVATGFGRTGTMFACQQEDVAPDLMCVAKGITGGYLPLAATLATERIYAGFLGRHDEYRTFFHGHTYTGNPLACAAAIATLDVFEEERTLERLQPKIELLSRLLEPIAGLPGVGEVRQRGFMAGIELEGFDPALRTGHKVTLEARTRGAIVRPLGDVVVLMPPLAIEVAELERLAGITREAIAAATGAGAIPLAA
ncbi:MAG TPA: adenosylmethionine--8-amino-7-oxononanoate transaminase [Thermoleophilaceae bacterium]|jgi:adenosylmethionine-8-amino-7-oxononanoate aminotransferase|nr:adenosylmethionine--8-amino-7-oxononanoate transaminase [Thermoleophilaceae bacterium]